MRFFTPMLWCGFIAFANPLTAAVTYQESGGLVIMEIENTASPLGLWEKKTNFPGYTGSGHLEFNGNKTSSGPATSPLTYTFKINKAGLYYLHFHCLKNINDGQPDDHSNDAYVKVAGDYGAGPNAGNEHGDDAPLATLQTDTKFYGGNKNAWAWASGNRLDLGGDGNKRVAVYDFKASKEYTLTVSGRSKYFNINRIVFRHTDTSTTNAQSLTIGESTTAVGGGTTKPSQPAAPTASGSGTAAPTVSGTTSPGATVHIFDNGTEIGTVTAGSDGKWTYTLTGLSAGSHAITVTAQNLGGTSAPSAPTNVNVDPAGGTPPPASDGGGGGSGCGLGGLSASLIMALFAFMKFAHALRTSARPETHGKNE